MYLSEREKSVTLLVAALIHAAVVVLAVRWLAHEQRKVQTLMMRDYGDFVYDEATRTTLR